MITPQGDIIQIGVKCRERQLSNNEAEYEVVIKALKVATQAGANKIHIKMDSQLVAQQYAGIYEVTEERMKAYVEDLKNRAVQLEELVIEQIPREDNDKADTLARMAGAAEGSWTGETTLLQEIMDENMDVVMEIARKPD
ncbi:uncharacterized protein LOC131018802 [Salvia miltiorrhiza]|uniref:uncharacterized protein LOC131018802 n=1 Tax=Salvia miltiorrhiza TaxID=226208 RepID=UPI0025ABA213|nr:uncharacterized protein LOC131018802 [Salvia miltiorrhiza]